MSDEATKIYEPTRHDTTRSWRVMRKVVVWLCSASAAVIGFSMSYTDGLKGDSESKLAEFESALRDYVRAATRLNYNQLRGIEISDYSLSIPEQAGLTKEGDRLSGAAFALSYQNRDTAKAKLSQAVAEYNLGRSAFADLIPMTSKNALKNEWVQRNTFEAIMKAFAVGAASAIVVWVVAWLVVVCAALVWWFFIDRLRDISRAIKGQ